jgi:transmembrane sensor
MQQDVYATGIGEQRTIALPDGSTVELNSRTRLRVSYHPHQRDVKLQSGQALFRVAKDASRPFVVHSDGAQVRAVGTKFDVYQKSGETIVTVVEGRVAVTPDSSPAGSAAEPMGIAERSAPLTAVAEFSLAAGEQLTVSKAVSPRPTPVDADAATSWTQHKIVFKSSPLPKVFEELNRYSKRPLRIQGTGLEDFRISGTYATGDPALLVRFLREQPGIVVEETKAAIIVSKTQ